ncbi:MAG: HlyD family secretion protein [Deltaproteobacteria bacterium]|nr:HlyD family secretion protein [Deltaproteobacteria bacterium]
MPVSNLSEGSNNKKLKITIAIIVASLLIIGGGVYYFLTKGHVSTDDAFIDGHIFSVTPRVAGYVISVDVDDNQEVKEGDPLVSLDPTEYEVAVAEARANLAESKFTLTSLELGVPLELSQTEQKVRGAESELNTLNKNLETKNQEEDAANQDLLKAQAEHDKAMIDFRRMNELLKGQAISQSTMDEVETRVQTTLAQVNAARAKAEAVKKQKAALLSDKDRLQANIRLASTGEDQAKIRSRQVEAQQARVELAAARLHQAELNLGYTNIKSPTHGFVTRKKVEPGQMVSRGQPLMAIVPLNPKLIWVTANYKETELYGVKPGQLVSIEVDTYSGVKFKGRVDSIMSGTGAAFSLFPPENATGNYVKIVQRIPVKIVFDTKEPNPFPALRIGMSVVPTIYTD